MLYSYGQLRDALTISDTPFLAIFERYCRAMRGNTRVLEWSCKTCGGRLEGARFLHTARSQTFADAADAVDRVVADVARAGDDTHPLKRLRAVGLEFGQGTALGYAETSRGAELKLYISTNRVDDVRRAIEPIVPRGGLPPNGTPRVMIAVTVDGDGACTWRVYYLWQRSDLGQAATRWLARWCTQEEFRLLSESSSRTVSVAFKAGKRDMLYLSVPLLHRALENMLLAHIGAHPIAFAQLDHLRWIGFSKHREGLATQELNTYFDSRF